MNKGDFVKAVAAKTGVTIKDAKLILDGAEEVVFDALETEEEVRPFNLLKISRILRDERIARNPATGETMTVPPKFVPKAQFSKGFKDFIKGLS